MSVRLQLAVMMLLAAFWAPAQAVTVQGAGDQENGNPFLYIEAESFLSTGGDPLGWVEVEKGSGKLSPGGLEILPETSNVSGTAMLDDIGGGSDTIIYEVQFSKPGTYQLYLRETMYDSNGNGNYGNEDSIYVSPAFDKNSSTDWVGFEGQEFDDVAGAYAPAVGDSPNDGWFATRDAGVKSSGAVEFHNNAAEDFWNGTFHWYTRNNFVATQTGGGFQDDFGFKNEYIVTADDLNKVMTFEIRGREPYVAIDGILFTANPTLLDEYSQEEVTALVIKSGGNPTDLNGDGAVDAADAGIMFGDWGGPGSTSAADFNKDGFVDAADAGTMFEAWTGDPNTPAAKAATAEYNPETGELKVSSAGAVNVFVQSASNSITPVSPAPAVPVGLLTNNTGRVGITNLGPIEVTNFSFGNIGKGLAMSDLKLVYTTALGTKGIEVPASADGNAAFKYIPEPASLGLIGIGLAGLLACRRR